jgi:lysophospholipase L1-like esterase
MNKPRLILYCLLIFLAALAAALGALALWSRGPAPGPADTPGMYRAGSWPELRVEHTPGARGTLNGVEVRIDGLGFRGPDTEEHKAAGATRIVVVGDSVVFGQGVAEDGTLPAQLARLLAAREPGRKWETINAGVRGYGTRDYRIIMERRVLPLGPDLVVLVLTEINDVEREPWSAHSARLDEWSRARWTRLPGVKPLLAGAYSREVSRLFRAHVKALYDPAGPDWAGFVADLTAIRDDCRARGVKLIAVTFPLIADEDVLAAERRQLQDLLGQLGIPLVDPRPGLSAYPEKDLTVSASDFHPNARALGITAERLVGPIAAAAGAAPE